MPSYFQNLQDTEISGGEFASIGGDFVGVDGVRHAGGPKDKSEPTSYFANGKGLKITGGNFMTVGGNFYHHGGARSLSPLSPPPRPPPQPQGPQYGRYGYTQPPPSPQRMPSPQPPPAPPQPATYNYQGGYGGPAEPQGYQTPYTSQPVPQHPPIPLENINSVRPPTLHSQSGPSAAPHDSANLSAPVELRHTQTEPTPPSHTELFIRPQQSGLDVPNHRPKNLNPTVDIWSQRPGEAATEYAGSDSDSDDEHKKKKKKGKNKLTKQFKNAFTRTSKLP